MFAGLKTIAKKDSAAVPNKRKKCASARLVDSTIKFSHAATRLRQGMTSTKAAFESFGDLRRLRNIVAVEGVSKSLMLFANPDNRTSAFVRGLPAVESLDAVALSPKDRLTMVAIEGMDETLDKANDVLVAWLEDTVANLGDVFEALGVQIDEMNTTGSNLLEVLAGASVSDEQLKGAVVVGISADAAVAKMAALADMLGKFDLPKVDAYDAEAFNAAVTAFGELVAVITDFTGVYADGYSVMADSEKVAEAYRPIESNLFDLGYNAEGLKKVLEASGALMGSLRALADKQPAMVERLRAIVEGLSNKEAQQEAAPAEGTQEPAPAAPAPAEGGEPAPAPAPATEDDNAEANAPTFADNVRDLVSGYVSLLLVGVEAATGSSSRVLAIAEDVANMVTPAESAGQ